MISSARTQTRWPSEISIFASFFKHGDRLPSSPQRLLSGWRQLEESIAITSRHLYSLHLCLRATRKSPDEVWSWCRSRARPGRTEVNTLTANISIILAMILFMGLTAVEFEGFVDLPELVLVSVGLTWRCLQIARPLFIVFLVLPALPMSE